MTRPHPRMCLLEILGFGWRPTILRGSNPPKPPKWGMVRHFPAKLAKYKIAISPAVKIKSTSAFDKVIELHSWLRWWSRITKFSFKMADGRQIIKCWKCYNLPMNGPICMKLGWSHPVMSPTCPPWCGGNGRCQQLYDFYYIHGWVED